MRKWLSGPTSRVWVLVPTLLALVMTAAWWWRLRPEATVWGPVVAWVGVAGSIGALIFAGQQVRLARLQHERLRSEDQTKADAKQRAMADAVGLTAIFTHSVKPEITNAGMFAIYSVQLWPLVNEDRVWRQAGNSSSIPGGVLIPGRTASVTLPLWNQFSNQQDLMLGVAICFQDTEGREWKRAQALSGQRIPQTVYRQGLNEANQSAGSPAVDDIEET